MKKNNYLLSLLFIFNLLLVSCSSRNKFISVFLYDSKDTFISSLNNKLIENFKDNKYDYEVYDGNNNPILQTDQVYEEINKKRTNLLLVNCVDRLSNSIYIEKASKMNLPIVFFNREPLDEDLDRYKNSYYVGSNPGLEGLLQAEMAIDLFKNPYNLNKKFDKNNDNVIQILLLKGEQGHQDSEQRSKYCIEGLTKNNFNVEVLQTVVCNWNREQSYYFFKKNYNNFKNKIELILSNNDDMALGAIDFLLENNIFTKEINNVLDQPFPIIGVDGTEVGKKAIQDKLMYGTIYNDAITQVDAITLLIDKLIRSEEIDINNFKYNFYKNTRKIYTECKKIKIDNL